MVCENNTNYKLDFFKRKRREKNHLINLVIIGDGEQFKLLKNKINPMVNNHCCGDPRHSRRANVEGRAGGAVKHRTHPHDGPKNPEI